MGSKRFSQMFRPEPERTLFKSVPLRHLLLGVIILILALTAMMVLNLEREKARADLPQTTAIVLLLAIVGIAAVVLHQNSRSINEAFEKAKTLARNILQSIATGVITLDKGGRIISVNTSAERILNLKNAAWHPYTEVFHSQPEIAEILRSALEDRAFVQEVELELIAGRRKSPTFVRLSTSDLQDAEGQSLGVVMLVRDCSELAQLERQLYRADKMAALGTLSAGLAHEIKNPLSAIDLNLHLLKEELQSGGHSGKEVQEYLEILNIEIKRLNSILDSFIRFSKPSELHLDELDLNEALRQVIALILHEAREKKVEVKAVFPSSLPQILGDETQLCQVFLNIMINALQAMPHGGVLEVASGISKTSSGFLEVRFSDTGIGILPEHLGKLFDPYFTTREGGMGLGLTIAYRIVRDHGGEIEVKSTPGSGTTVTVKLPMMRHEFSERVRHGAAG